MVIINDFGLEFCL